MYDFSPSTEHEADCTVLDCIICSTVKRVYLLAERLHDSGGVGDIEADFWLVGGFQASNVFSLWTEPLQMPIVAASQRQCRRERGSVAVVHILRKRKAKLPLKAPDGVLFFKVLWIPKENPHSLEQQVFHDLRR